MRLTALAVALTAVLLLASCSSETPQPQQQEPATSVSTPPAHGALAQCLAEHGVPAAPGPVAGPPPGVDQVTWEKAMQACSSLEPGPTTS